MSRGEWAGGLFTVVFAFVLPSIALTVTGAVTGAFDEPPEIIEEEVISATFVRLGREFENQLPNRRVPQAATAPPDSVALDRPEETVEREEPQRERPERALERDLDNLLERSALFAEEAEQRELEGSENGVEDGTATEATAGDEYGGLLRNFFRRGWSVPTTISDEERRELSVMASVDVDESLQIVAFRLRGSSGNPDFDQSVTEQLERLRAANATIPPLDGRFSHLRTQYVGQWFTARFRGRDAR